MSVDATAVTAPHVLVVDDDEGNRETLRVVLEDISSSITASATSAQTLHALQTASTGLVVVFDVLLPSVDDGLFVLRTVCADEDLRRRHAFVAITASPQKMTPAVHELLAQLSAPLITKPFDIDALLRAVTTAASHLEPPRLLAGDA